MLKAAKMNWKEIEALLDGYSTGTASPNENKLVESWLKQTSNDICVWRKMGEEEKYEWLNDLYVDIKTTSFLHDRKEASTKVIRAFFIVAIIIAAVFVLQLLI